MSEQVVNGNHNPVENLQHMIVGGAEVIGYHHDVIDGPAGVYMVDVLPESVLDVQFTAIEPLESLSMGASDTHHQVRFGVVSYTDGEGEEKETVIGIKHFDDALDNAISECDSLLKVQARGFDALSPLALVKESETSSYLITLFRPDAISLDDADWTPRPGEKGHDTVKSNLNFIAESMASLHARGVFHGDAQPKNFVRSDTGKQIVVDLEAGCRITDSPKEHIAAFNDIEEGRMGTAYHDLKLMWTTLNRSIGLRQENIFLGNEATPAELHMVFKEEFITPYLLKLERDTYPSVFAQFDVSTVVGHIEAVVRSQLGLPEQTSALE
jgi:hypothetical protein